MPEEGTLATETPAAPPPRSTGRASRVVLPESADRVGRAVNSLAWPIIIENLFQTALGTANMIMVGSLGASAIAGVGTSNQLVLVMQASISALTTGTTVLVARLSGARQPEEADRIVKQSLTLGIIVSLAFSALGLFASEWLVAALGAEPEVVALGGEYFRIVAGASLLLVLMLVCSAALRGAGDTRTPMMVTGTINFINLIVSYVLIFGHLGVPALGVSGAAWGATVARAVGAVTLLTLLVRGRGAVRITGRSGWGINPGLIWRLLRLGLPSMLEQMFLSGGNLLYGTVAIGLGTTVYATQRVTLQAMSLAFQPGMGFALGSTAMVGQCLGAKRVDLSERAARHAVRMAVIWMTTISALMAIFGRSVMGLFTTDPEMISIGSRALMVIAFSQPLQAIAQVTAGSLRGAGDTRFPMVSTFLGVWLFRLPFSYLFGPVLGWGLAGMYIANVLDGAARAIATTWRFRRGKWRSINV
ncbi:MAG: MATE family efflux transporter [Anaerolineae bacterium]